MFNLKLLRLKTHISKIQSITTLPNSDAAALQESKNKQSEITSKIEATKQITVEDLKWRTPWHEKEGQHYTFLRSFYTTKSNTNVLKILQTPFDLSPATLKRWWAKKQERKNVYLQSYIPERNQTLGNELAAAHFIVHRGGAVKFFGEDKWIKANEHNEYSLPNLYDSDKVLQAIDCTYMNLYYEGLVNLRDLRQVEWLSLYGCQHMDDWCVDRISNIFSKALLYLDLRECPQITEKGLGALCKLQTLKILYVDSLVNAEVFEMTCLMLQDVNPALEIRTG